MKLNNYKKVLLTILMSMLLLTLKMPSGTPLYKITYVLLFFYFICKNSTRKTGKINRISLSLWMIVIIWGILLSFLYGINERNIENLSWVLSIAVVPYCMSQMFRKDEDRVFIYRVIIAITIAIAISGLYESYTGVFYHLTNDIYALNKNTYGFYRPNTIFFNVNDNAIFMFCCTVIAFFYPHEQKEAKYIRLLALFLYGGNILMTDSRGALLALAVFMALYYSYQIGSSKRYTLIFGIILLSFFYLPVVLSDEFFSLSDRLPVWEASLANVKDTGFLGVGPGMIANINEQHYVGVDITAVHNFFLELFCDYGIIGLSCILLWFFSMLTIANKTKERITRSILMASLISMLFATITCSSLIGKAFPLLFFSVIIAEINRQEDKNCFLKLRI